MSTFEVDTVILVEADSDQAAEDLVVDTLTENTNIKAVEVAYIADTNTYGK